MKKITWKRMLSVALAATMVAGVFTGCGKSSSKSNDPDHFSMWIFQTDGAGKYYTDYNDSAAVQYIEAQTWDTENGGIGDGESLDFDFQVPVAGSENQITLIHCSPQVIILIFWILRFHLKMQKPWQMTESLWISQNM